jgi:hypothetical protein
MADEEEEGSGERAGEKPGRIGLNPSDVTVRYLKQLLSLGIYGKNVTQVAARLVDEGIRRAIVEGLIEKERDL